MDAARLPRLATRLLILCALLLTVASARAQGHFEMEAADIPALKLLHYYGTDRQMRAADFSWTFTRDAFTLKKGSAPIPADLVATLLPDDAAKAAPDEITGKWAFKDGKLVLTEIKAGDKAGRKEATLSPYKTAPTVVRIGHLPQYVFEVVEKAGK